MQMLINHSSGSFLVIAHTRMNRVYVSCAQKVLRNMLGGYEGFLFFMNLRKMCFLKIIQLKDIVNRFYKVKL